jgi:biopolymer transport protein ExbB
MKILSYCTIVLLAVTPVVFAQEENADEQAGFDKAAQTAQRKLEASIAELNQLRQQIAEEKVPLGRKLSELENELVKTRMEYQQVSRMLDSRMLDLNNLRNEIKSRHEESAYLSSLLGEYTRNFESRLHIAEIQRYRRDVETAKLSVENSNLTDEEIYRAQAVLLNTSLERLNDALGGASFHGTAADAGGLMKKGTFVMFGPVAIFKSEDGKNIGMAEQRLGSLEPAIIEFNNPEDTAAALALVSNSKGQFPLDPTLGNAHKVEETKETVVEHIKKGGAVMYPIIILAAAALLVALFKWLTMVFIRTPSRKKITELLKAVAGHREAEALKNARAIGGPVGKMLVTGVEHIREPRELIEEVMYEHVLATRLKLGRMLPFIALTSSSAPLLGLLGTVTGIMNTFTLMTVFGTGDIKTLSSGISEALITTEYGLYVAIPSLLLFAFLSRKAKTVIDEMEKAAVAFVNQVSKTPYQDDADSQPAGEMVSLS